jgi:hypothetical protein
MGGVSAFGFVGIVLGPLVAALVTALFESYDRSLPGGGSPPGGAVTVAGGGAASGGGVATTGGAAPTGASGLASASDTPPQVGSGP